MSLLIRHDDWKWLRRLGILDAHSCARPAEGHAPCDPDAVALSQVHTSLLLVGIHFYRILVYYARRFRVQLGGTQLREKGTLQNRLFNWNVLSQGFHELGFRMSYDFKTRIVSGDREAAAVFLNDLHSFLSEDAASPGAPASASPLLEDAGQSTTGVYTTTPLPTYLQPTNSILASATAQPWASNTKDVLQSHRTFWRANKEAALMRQGVANASPCVASQGGSPSASPLSPPGGGSPSLPPLKSVPAVGVGGRGGGESPAKCITDRSFNPIFSAGYPDMAQFLHGSGAAPAKGIPIPYLSQPLSVLSRPHRVLAPGMATQQRESHNQPGSYAYGPYSLDPGSLAEEEMALRMHLQRKAEKLQRETSVATVSLGVGGAPSPGGVASPAEVGGGGEGGGATRPPRKKRRRKRSSPQPPGGATPDPQGAEAKPAEEGEGEGGESDVQNTRGSPSACSGGGAEEEEDGAVRKVEEEEEECLVRHDEPGLEGAGEDRTAEGGAPTTPMHGPSGGHGAAADNTPDASPSPAPPQEAAAAAAAEEEEEVVEEVGQPQEATSPPDAGVGGGGGGGGDISSPGVPAEEGGAEGMPSGVSEHMPAPGGETSGVEAVGEEAEVEGGVGDGTEREEGQQQQQQQPEALDGDAGAERGTPPQQDQGQDEDQQQGGAPTADSPTAAGPDAPPPAEAEGSSSPPPVSPSDPSTPGGAPTADSPTAAGPDAPPAAEAEGSSSPPPVSPSDPSTPGGAPTADSPTAAGPDAPPPPAADAAAEAEGSSSPPPEAPSDPPTPAAVPGGADAAGEGGGGPGDAEAAEDVAEASPTGGSPRGLAEEGLGDAVGGGGGEGEGVNDAGDDAASPASPGEAGGVGEAHSPRAAEEDSESAILAAEAPEQLFSEEADGGSGQLAGHDDAGAAPEGAAAEVGEEEMAEAGVAEGADEEEEEGEAAVVEAEEEEDNGGGGGGGFPESPEAASPGAPVELS